MSWITRLFRGTDRAAAAVERSAIACEQIAEAMEACRDTILSRFALPAPEALAPVAAIAVTAEEPETGVEKRNSRKKLAI